MNDNNINAEPIYDKLCLLLNLFKELPDPMQDKMLEEIISAVQESGNTSQ